MEARKITIIQSRNQSKKVIMSAATTLAELKVDLSANGIDYTDMTFYEGLSHTELKTDNSILPHDVPYKGNLTNELVFMLTTTNKKIKSGSYNRIEVYGLIKSHNLQDICKQEFGKNYTMCKTEDLINILNKYADNIKGSNVEAQIKVENKPTNEGCTYKEVCGEKDSSSKCVDYVVRKALALLVAYLKEDNYISEDIYLRIQEAFVGIDSNKSVEVAPKEEESPYSSDELDEMFEDMI